MKHRAQDLPQFSIADVQRAVESEKAGCSARVPVVDPERVKLVQSYLDEASKLLRTAETNPRLNWSEARLTVARVNQLVDKMMAAAGLAENIER